MASSPDDKKTEVERTFQDRINNYYPDLGAATEAQAVTIDQQYHDAETAYNLAFSKAFLGNSPKIESVMAELKATNDKVDKLRADSESIAKILTAASQALSLARLLALIAG